MENYKSIVKAIKEDIVDRRNGYASTALGVVVAGLVYEFSSSVAGAVVAGGLTAIAARFLGKRGVDRTIDELLK